MNHELFYCPIRGCTHSNGGTARPFPSRTVLLRHLNSTSHSSTHHLVNHSDCATSGIYTCCAPSCPTSPKIFFSSHQALNDHCQQLFHKHHHQTILHPHTTPPQHLPTQSVRDSSTRSLHQTPQIIGNTASTSSTQCTTMNRQNSAQHGAISSAHETKQHSPTSKHPSYVQLLKPTPHVTPSTAQHPYGGYYFISICSSSHPPLKNSATTFQLDLPSAIVLMQHTVVILLSSSTQP